MDDAKRELIQSWLAKAAHDLAAAGKLAAEPDPVLDSERCAIMLRQIGRQADG
jgi:hypothetical protein